VRVLDDSACILLYRVFGRAAAELVLYEVSEPLDGRLNHAVLGPEVLDRVRGVAAGFDEVVDGERNSCCSSGY